MRRGVDIGDLRELMLKGAVREGRIDQVLSLALDGLRTGNTTPEFQSLLADILDPAIDTDVKVKWTLRHAAPKKSDLKRERAEAVWERVRLRDEGVKAAIIAVVEERKALGDDVSPKTVDANWRAYRDELDHEYEVMNEANPQ